MKQRNAVFRVYGIRVQQVILNVRSGLPKHIGDYGIQRQIAHSESVLKTVLSTGTHGYELAPIAGKLTENTGVLTWNVTAGNQSHTKQIPDPLGILFVILVALHSGNPLRVCDNDMAGIFKDIPNRNPILAGTLHANVFAVVFKQPLLERNETVVKGREPLLVVMWHDILAGNDCGDEKSFVNIDTTTDWICELHIAPPF